MVIEWKESRKRVEEEKKSGCMNPDKGCPWFPCHTSFQDGDN